MELDDTIARARRGDARAQDELARATKDLVFNLAIRMLGSPADAEDATQEILWKLVTKLDSYRGESAFRTWAYRVAANHLLTTRKRAAEQRFSSLEEMGERLDANLADGDPPADDRVLVNEAKLICTSMMLTCLDREHRLAYILGEILELPGDEAAAALEISPDAYRKRVSRARARMDEFMGRSCGLVDASRPCRCGKQAAHGVRVGHIDPKCLVWTSRPTAAPPERQVGQARVDDIDGLSRAVAVYRGHPTYVAPKALVDRLRHALDAGTSDLLR